MRARSLLLGLTMMTSLLANAQHQTANQRPRCIADLRHSALMNSDASYREIQQQQENRVQQLIANGAAQRTEGVIYKIPVVVHVIHNGEAVGVGTNISDAQIQSAITNMTQAYRGQIGVANDAEIEFVLAKMSPSACATSTGIVRVNGSGVAGYTANGLVPAGFPGDNELAVKNLSRWDNNNYYNIWVVSKIDGSDAGGIQAFAYFPGTPATYDGTVCLYNSFGYDPTGSLGYNLKPYTNKNKTLIHEMGHAFDLYHTFEGDDPGNTGIDTQCPANGNPLVDGDKINDTEPHRRSYGAVNTAGCYTPGVGINGCTGAVWGAVTKNYLDYSDETCQDRFSPAQITRMRAAITGTSRLSLASSYASAAPYPATFVNPMAASCTPVTSATGLSNHFAGISKVAIGIRNFFSGSAKDDGGYYNQSGNCMSLVRLEKGLSNNVAVTVHTANTHQVKAWIDYNNDGVFDNATEMILNQASVAAGATVSAAFTAPGTANTTTVVRMRVLEELVTTSGGVNLTGACVNPTYGQAEDYPVRLYNLGTLPIKLNNFSVSSKNCTNSLSVKFDDAKDLRLLRMQRSTNGGISFETINEQNANGLQYNFTDAFSATAAYRIEMLLKDGTTEYSYIVKTNACGEKENSVSVYPNPASNYVIVSKGSNSNAHINILNANGAVVKQMITNNNQTKIDVTNIPTGVYMIQVQEAGNVSTLKFIKN